MSSESAGAPAVLTSGAGGEGLGGDGGANGTSGGSGNPNGGADATGGGGAAGAAPSSDDGGQSGAAGSGGSAGTSGTIVQIGPGASSCPFAAPELLSGLGLESSSMWGTGLAQGSLTLVFASRPSGDEDVFEASRHERGTNFEPAALVQGINTTSDDGTPFLFPDGLSIYFYSSRSGGVGSRDLYVATRASLADAFTNTQLLANVNSAANDHLPRLTADALTLVFTSTRSGGPGGADLWTATRDDVALDFDAPVPIEGVNTSADEESGVLSADQLTLVFDSSRSGGLGGSDLWSATRSSTSSPFEPAINLSGLNSTSHERNVFVSDDGEEIFFSSDRGDGTTHQLWRAARNCDL
jgi:hypothetical protein